MLRSLALPSARSQVIDPGGPEQVTAVCQTCWVWRRDHWSTRWGSRDRLGEGRGAITQHGNFRAVLFIRQTYQSFEKGNNFWMKLWTCFWRVSMVGHFMNEWLNSWTDLLPSLVSWMLAGYSKKRYWTPIMHKAPWNQTELCWRSHPPVTCILQDPGSASLLLCALASSL